MGTKSYVYDIRNYSEISNGEEINRHLNNSANWRLVNFSSEILKWF